MAAPRKYPSVHGQLRELAERALLDGRPFDAFWLEAVRPELPAVTWATAEEDRPAGCVVWPRDTFDRNTSRRATAEARDGWRRAYEGAAPSRTERALIRLAPLLSALEARQAEEEPAALAVAV